MRIFNIFIITLLLVSLFIPFIAPSPTYADNPPGKKVEIENLAFGKVRLDEYTTAQLEGTYTENGQTVQNWTATISSLPETMPDLKTKITIEWRKGRSDDGVIFYENGNNIYYARVTGTRVSVEYEGILSAWDPTIYIGSSKLDLTKGPRLVQDPLENAHYGANTIEWVYETPGGLFSKSFRVLRYLRQIEGLLQEFYILESNPGATFKVVNGYKEEPGFRWTGEVYAYDSGGRSVEVVGDASEKSINFRELGRPELEYPIIVDPTDSFITSSYDGGYSMGGTTYSEAWTGSGGSGYDLRTNAATFVGQSYTPDVYLKYSVQRSFVMFNTAGLQDDATITYSCYLKLYGQHDSSVTNFWIIIQSGMPTYPHMPYVQDDFAASHYSGSGGGISTSGWSLTGYNSILLSDAGMSWINKVGWTKFCLRSDRDISQLSPTTLEDVGFYAYEKGIPYQPTLYVTYTTPITKPTISTHSPATSITQTSATVSGTLINDGGTPCDTYFDYGTTTSYGPPTSSAGIKTTGQTFSKSITGLLPGTLYHYTARAQSSGGISDANDKTLLTRPSVPTNFEVNPGNGFNLLTWNKGTGSTHTVIRSSTSSYPTSPTGGTSVYNDVGTSYNNTPLTNNITYYYSAWAYTAQGDWSQYSATYATKPGTPVALGPPSVITYAATNVASTTATLNGKLDSLSGYSDADVWFQYYWGAGSWTELNGETTYVMMTVTGTVAPVDISSLPPNTQIHQRIAALGDGGGPVYGSDVPFSTNETFISAPTILTQSALGVTGVSATLYGKIIEDGGALVTVRFQWGSTSAYGHFTGEVSDLTEDDPPFYTTLTGLEPSTTYHFMAEGWNSAYPGYGVDANFTTSAPSAPDVLTLTQTEVGATTAKLHGQLTSDGGVDTDVRFTWSDNVTLSVNTTSSGWQTDKRTGALFEHFASNLSYETKYYFRAEASNTPGVVINGTIKDFTTVFTAPTKFSAIPLTSTSISLTWIPQSDKISIYAKIDSYPADRLDGTPIYFGPGHSTVYEGLIPGTTYFFRAWSWRSGDNYSGTYAEDAATTFSTGGISEMDMPSDEYGVVNPEAPTGWWQGPGSSKIQKWPLVPYIDSIADGMGMDRGTMWVIFAGLAAVLVAMAGAVILPLRYAGFFAGLIAVAVLAGVGVLIWWILIFYAVAGIALLILLPSGAGG